MRMATYIVRRLLLILPVLIGVTTITFLLFTSLPVSYQLLAHFGVPGQKAPCGGYFPSCDCEEINPHSVSNTTCQCPATVTSPATNTTPYASCPNPLYVSDVHQLGLDKPIPVQWATYIYNSFTFQWGTVSNNSYIVNHGGVAFIADVPVVTVLSWFLPYTLELAILSLIIILAIAIPLGNASAVNRNRPVDQLSRVMSFSGYAIPAFLLGSFLVVGLTLILLPTVGLTSHQPWCPGGEPLTQEFTYSWPQGGKACYPHQLLFPENYPHWLTYGVISHPTGFPTVDAMIHGDYWLALDSIIRMIVPALVIAYGTVAGLLRFVRNSMLEVMNLDYVRTARAKGVPEKAVIRRHAGRNSLNVTITVLGLTFAFFVGGFPVIESVFHLWGVGELLAYSVVPNIDFAMIFGSTLLFTFLVVGANIIVDVLYAFLDPRVRIG